MERWELQQMQSLTLEAKIIKSQQRIREWHEHWQGDTYVSFSGGLDSTVLLNLVHDIYKDVPAVFIDTGLEFPEVRSHALSFNPVVVRPKLTFKQVIDKYGYPVVSKEQAHNIYQARTTKSAKLLDLRMNGRLGRNGKRIFGKISEKWKFLLNAPFKISDKCCDYLKKEPIHRYEKQTSFDPFVGLKATDSAMRLSTLLQRGGCNAFTGKQQSWPLSFWTDQDVLQYVKEGGLRYPTVYGDIIGDVGCLTTTGESRTGCMFCMFCMFGCHKDKVNRFQRMKETHPKIYKYCMEQLGLCEVLEFMGIPH